MYAKAPRHMRAERLRFEMTGGDTQWESSGRPSADESGKLGAGARA